MNEAIEVMKLGFGMPAFNNDEIIIPSFIAKVWQKKTLTITQQSAALKRLFQPNGAISCTGMSYMNFPKILLITMNNGIDPASGKRFAPEFGHFVDMTSYES